MNLTNFMLWTIILTNPPFLSTGVHMSDYPGFINAVTQTLTAFKTNKAITDSPVDALIAFAPMSDHETDLIRMYHASLFNPTRNNTFGEQSVNALVKEEVYYVYHDAKTVVVYFTLKHYGLAMLMFTPQVSLTGNPNGNWQLDGLFIISRHYNLTPAHVPYKIVANNEDRILNEIAAIQAVQADTTSYYTAKVNFDSATRTLKCEGMIPNTMVYVYNITDRVEVADGHADANGNVTIGVPFWYHDNVTDMLVVRNDKQHLRLAGLGVDISEPQLNTLV